MEKITLQYKIWLETPDGKGIMGDGKWEMLKTIRSAGSLVAACEAMGYTYRKTWGEMKKIEQLLGFPLLEKTRGGKDGGNTQLTPQGEKMVAAFDALHHKMDTEMEHAFDDFKKIIDRLK